MLPLHRKRHLLLFPGATEQPHSLGFILGARTNTALAAGLVLSRLSRHEKSTSFTATSHSSASKAFEVLLLAKDHLKRQRRFEGQILVASIATEPREDGQKGEEAEILVLTSGLLPRDLRLRPDGPALEAVGDS